MSLSRFRKGISIPFLYLSSPRGSLKTKRAIALRLTFLAFIVHVSHFIVTGYAQNSRSTLKQLWTASLTEGNATPLSAPVATLQWVAIATGSLEAFNLEGRPLWHKPLSMYQPKGLLAEGPDLIVAEDSVYSIGGLSGVLNWRFSPGGNFSFAKPSGVKEGVLVGNDAGKLYQLDILSGNPLWSLDLSDNTKARTVVTGISSDNGNIFVALTVVSGSSSGNRCYGYLVKLDSTTRQVRWRFKLEQPGKRVGITAEPLVLGRMVVVVDGLGNTMLAIDKETGEELWRFSGDPSGAGIPEPPLLLENTLYVGSGDRFAYAVQAKDGKMIWKAQMKSSITSLALCGKRILVLDGGLDALSLQGNAEPVRVDGLAVGLALSRFGRWTDGLSFADATSLHVLRCSSEPSMLE